MSRPRGGTRELVALPAVAALTSWCALLSWGGFTSAPGRSLGPLLVLGAVVAGTGALARRVRAPGVVVVLLQVVLTGMAGSAMLTGSPLPVGSAWGELGAAFSRAMSSATQYAAPVPADVPGVHPILVAGGLACLLLVDVLACTLRRAPLAGLPLLAIYSIPVSLLGGGVSWWIFAMTATGFLAMLFLQEDAQVARWGRPLGDAPGATDVSRVGVRNGAVRVSASRIGGVATALAVVVPLMIPTLSLHLFDLGNGHGGGSGINVENPMVDLRRDLQRGPDVPLLRVTTDDPRPDYLRIAVLNRFTSNEWSAGDRDVPTDHLPDGPMPQLDGVSASVPRTSYDYQVSVDDSFASTWLPTEAPISAITAAGDWRYDLRTMDFLASEDNLTTAGMSYSMTGVKLVLSATQLSRAPNPPGLVSSDFLDLPTDMPPLVGSLAQEVTRDAPSRFEKAVALQTWFRETGGFTYDLHRVPGNGTDDLVAFLSEGEGGRTGYCEQFAAAMAVMARTLGIPARVAIGFLEPDKVGPRTYEYSTDDLHAWPELFFAGAGWVRFEPTPAGRASDVPSYTTQGVTAPEPTRGPTSNPRIGDQPTRHNAAPLPNEPTGPVSRPRASASSSWLPVAGGVVGVLLVATLLLLPRVLRRRRRELRLAGGPEAAWAELRATSVDLGVPWPEHRTPRETREVLVGHLGSPVGDDTPERPGRGPGVAPEAVSALDRLVGVLERERYARSAGPATSLRDDVETCLASLEGGASRSARRRAQWWPRSVLERSGRSGRDSGQRPVQARYGGVVDHVG